MNKRMIEEITKNLASTDSFYIRTNGYNKDVIESLDFLGLQEWSYSRFNLLEVDYICVDVRAMDYLKAHIDNEQNVSLDIIDFKLNDQNKMKKGDKIIINKLNQNLKQYHLKVGDIVTIDQENNSNPWCIMDDGTKVAVRLVNASPYSGAQSTIKSMIAAGKNFYIKTDNNNNDLCDYFESLGLSLWGEEMTERTTSKYLCIDLRYGNKDYLNCSKISADLPLFKPEDYKQELKEFMSTKKSIQWHIDNNKEFTIKFDNIQQRDEIVKYLKSLGEFNVPSWSSIEDNDVTSGYVFKTSTSGIVYRDVSEDIDIDFEFNPINDIDLSFSSQQEIWQWLINGNEVVSKVTDSIFKFNDDGKLINSNSGSVSLFEISNVYSKHIEPEPTQWYNNLGKGRFCRVEDHVDQSRIALVISFAPDEYFEFKDNSGTLWKYAEPLTREEVLEYLDGVE